MTDATLREKPTVNYRKEAADLLRARTVLGLRIAYAGAARRGLTKSNQNELTIDDVTATIQKMQEAVRDFNAAMTEVEKLEAESADV